MKTDTTRRKTIDKSTSFLTIILYDSIVVFSSSSLAPFFLLHYNKNNNNRLERNRERENSTAKVKESPDDKHTQLVRMHIN